MQNFKHAHVNEFRMIVNFFRESGLFKNEYELTLTCPLLAYYLPLRRTYLLNTTEDNNRWAKNAHLPVV